MRMAVEILFWCLHCGVLLVHLRKQMLNGWCHARVPITANKFCGNNLKELSIENGIVTNANAQASRRYVGSC
jgi:hypothetical protein